jgi:hypothetical protein
MIQTGFGLPVKSRERKVKGKTRNNVITFFSLFINPSSQKYQFMALIKIYKTKT